MKEINIDATDCVTGRLASYVAKQALLGNKINVLNSEKMLMSGSLENNFAKYYHRIKKTGQPRKGPFIPRMPDRFAKRLIRGMLPHKRQRGIEAYKRIMCYLGVPTELKDKKLTIYEPSKTSSIFAIKHTSIYELCKKLGGKI